jgi:hypothetical protein
MFENLTTMMDVSDSLRKVLILDCCHVGGIKISGGKGDDGSAEEEDVKGENEAAKLGRRAISDAVERSIRIGQGTCVFASSLVFYTAKRMWGRQDLFAFKVILLVIFLSGY